MGAIKLTLNESKTCIRNARQERFNFLGYSFGQSGIGKMATGIWLRSRLTKRFKG